MSEKVYVPNTFQTPNVLIDSVMPAVSTSAFKVLIAITRLTLGWRDHDLTGPYAVEIGIGGTQGLAALTGLSHQSVISGVQELKKLELIRVKKGPRNSRTPNQYALNLNLETGRLVKNLDQSKSFNKIFRPVLVKIFDSLRNTGNPEEPGRETPKPDGQQREKENRSASPARDSSSAEAFTEWYQAYPRHEARADAEKAWCKLNPDAALRRTIMAATANYAAAKANTEKQFIKLPASWLNGRRWEDDLEEPCRMGVL